MVLLQKAVDNVTATGVNYFTSMAILHKSYEGVAPITPPAGYTGHAHDFGGNNYFRI